MTFQLTPPEPPPDLDAMTTDEICDHVTTACDDGNVDALLESLDLYSPDTRASVLGAAMGWAACQPEDVPDA